MAPEPVEKLGSKVEAFNRRAEELGVSVRRRSPAMALSSLALTVIPEIRISDKGLVQVDEQRIAPLIGDQAVQEARVRGSDNVLVVAFFCEDGAFKGPRWSCFHNDHEHGSHNAQTNPMHLGG